MPGDSTGDEVLTAAALGPRRTPGSSMRRFAVVGVANTAIDFLLFGLLSVVGVPLLLANFVSTSAGMTFSYVANRTWAFGSTASVRRSLVPFLAVTGVGLWLVQPLVIALTADALDGSGLATDLRTIWIPKAVAIGVGMVWNFGWYHRVVFADAAGPSAVATTDTAAVPGRLLRVGSLLVALSFVWVALTVVVAPKYGAARWPQALVIVLAALTLVALVGFVLLTRRPVAWLEERRWVRRGLVASYLVAMFAVQVRLGYSIRFDPGWDAGTMENFSRGVADGTLTVQSVADAYAQYPNNLLLLSLMTRMWRAWLGAGYTDVDLAIVLVNGLVMCAAVLLTYLTARRLGRPATAYVLGIFCFVFVGVSPWIGVLYSDTVGMLPVAALAYLVAVLHGTTAVAGRTAAWTGIGLVGAVGYQIKPTVIFAVMAAVLVGVLGSRLTRWTRQEAHARLGAVLGLALGLVAGQLGSQAVIDRSGLTTPPERAQLALPISHFLMMGASEKPGVFNPYYGAYRDEDYALTQSIPPGPEREENGYAEYRRRVEAMGPLGYAEFLSHKATWTLGDGTFFMYGEGSMAVEPTPFVHTTPLDRRIQQYLGLHGAHFGLVVDVWQAFWIVVLLLMAAPLLPLRDRALSSLPAHTMRAGIFGLTLFTLLFEGRSRYFYLYLPFFLLLASLAVVALADRVPARLVPDRRPQPDDKLVVSARRQTRA